MHLGLCKDETGRAYLERWNWTGQGEADIAGGDVQDPGPGTRTQTCPGFELLKETRSRLNQTGPGFFLGFETDYFRGMSGRK